MFDPKTDVILLRFSRRILQPFFDIVKVNHFFDIWLLLFIWVYLAAWIKIVCCDATIKPRQTKRSLLTFWKMIAKFNDWSSGLQPSSVYKILLTQAKTFYVTSLSQPFPFTYMHEIKNYDLKTKTLNVPGDAVIRFFVEI